eukprot:UN01322
MQRKTTKKYKRIKKETKIIKTIVVIFILLKSNMESNISNMTKKVSKIERMYDSGKRLKQKNIEEKRNHITSSVKKVSKRETNNHKRNFV